MKKTFIIIFSAIILAVPLAASAQDQDSCGKLESQFSKYGGGNIFGGFKYCSTGEVFAKIVTLALTLIAALTIVGVIYGGILYITSGGNEATAKKGKQIALYSVAGLVVVIMATVIVTVISRLVVDNRVF